MRAAVLAEGRGMRATALAVALAAALFGGCGGLKEVDVPPIPVSPERPSGDERLRLVSAGAGFDAPLGLVAGRGRLWVVEQTGRVRDLRAPRRVLLDVSEEISNGGERGLLSIAFGPRDDRLYAHFTDRRGDTRVVEVGPRARRQLLFADQPYANHNGGQLAFGPDGRLYLGLGDGGDAFDPQARAQDRRSPLGKLLRTEPGASEPRWEQVAYGLRNPWRFSFDRRTDDLYIGDVGQDRWEEIDVIPGAVLARAGRRAPPNLGWDVFEGRERSEERDLSGDGPLVWPIAVYGHDQGCSVTGGHVYRGRAIPSMRGRYLYGDYCSGRIWSLRLRGGRAQDIRLERIRVPLLTSFGEDSKGELYLTSGRGRVYRLARAE